MMDIAACRMADLDALVELFEAYRSFYRAGPDAEGARRFLRERLENGDAVILLARSKAGQAVGFTQLYPSFSSVRMQPIWILNDLYVARTAREQGIGRALMDAARQQACDAGASVLVLATERDNQPARRLYESCGYVLDTVFDHYELDLGDS